MASIIITCDAQKVIDELDRLARGPDTHSFEGIMAATFAAVDAKVHVLTGRLKSSGQMHSSWTGDTWTGEIGFARYPGIYELARGDTPTKTHPEGGHHFFEPAYDTGKEYEAAVMDFLADGGGL